MTRDEFQARGRLLDGVAVSRLYDVFLSTHAFDVRQAVVDALDLLEQQAVRAAYSRRRVDPAGPAASQLQPVP